MEALREQRRDLQIAFTHFSPSAEALAKRFGADVATYLPWDLPETVAEALEGLAPSLVVFTKTEAWPVLAEEADARRVAVALVGASVHEGSGRARWPARWLLRTTWGRLALGCANTGEDAAKLVELGFDPTSVHVTGDPGIDSAAKRADSADPDAPYLAPFHAAPAPTLVAGSTWRSGEDVLLPAVTRLRRTVAGLRIIVAPHEPSSAHVGSLVERLGGLGWTPTTLGEVESRGVVGAHDAIVVDSVGVLAHLYTVGDIAYVGGGFHDQGLHSVLEPAAAGVPVLFGHRHRGARAAPDLVGAGGAMIASDTKQMERALSGWFADEVSRKAAGSRASGYVDDHRGAAARTADLLKPLIRSHNRHERPRSRS